jgi:hypothetical protein
MVSDYVGNGGHIIMKYYIYDFSFSHVLFIQRCVFIHSSVDDIESPLIYIYVCVCVCVCSIKGTTRCT